MALINQINESLIRLLSGQTGASTSGTVKLATVDGNAQVSGSTANYDAAFTTLRTAFYHSYARTSNSLSALLDTRDMLAELEDLTDQMVKLSDQSADASSDSARRDALNSQLRVLSRKFEKVFDRAEEDELDFLATNDLETILKTAGIDPRDATRLSEAFAKIGGDDGRIGYEKVPGEQVVTSNPTESALPPGDPLANTIRTRATALVSAGQLRELKEEIAYDVNALNTIIEEVNGARNFAISGVQAVDTLKTRNFRDAEKLASALATSIRNLSADGALEAHSSLDRELAKSLGLS